MVRSVGARRGLVDADLDEVMQEVRIRLWQTAEGGKDITALGSSYLYRVASSAALDLIRRRRAKGGDRTDDIEAQDTLAALSPSPVDATEGLEVARRINDVVSELAQDRRVAVRMYLNGHDHNEIARVLGWSEARARNLLYRGLDQVRKRLVLLGITPASLR